MIIKVQEVQIYPEYPENTPGVIRVESCNYKLSAEVEPDDDIEALKYVTNSFSPLGTVKVEMCNHFKIDKERLELELIENNISTIDLVDNEESHTEEEMREKIAQRISVSPEVVIIGE